MSIIAGKSTLWIIALAALFVGGIYFLEIPVTNSLILLFLISFGCELVDSSLGMGYGTLLTPTALLLGYDPAEIIPTILVSELFTGFSAAYFHEQIKNVDWSFTGVHLQRALLLMVGSVLGVIIGVTVSFAFHKESLLLIIGTIIFLSGLFVIILSNRIIEYKNWKMILLSITAAFNKSISGGGYGPLITSGQILSGIKGKSAVGITALTEGFTCLLAVLLFGLKGAHIHYNIFLPMFVGALLSIPFSVTAVSLSKDTHLKFACGLLTMTLGILTVYKALARLM